MDVFFFVGQSRLLPSTECFLKKYNDDLTLEQAQAEIKDNESVNGTKEQQSGSIFSRVRNAAQRSE